MYNPLNHVYLCAFVCLQGENNQNQHAQPKRVGSCGLTVLKIPNGLKDKGHCSHKNYYIQVCCVMCYVLCVWGLQSNGAFWQSDPTMSDGN